MKLRFLRTLFSTLALSLFLYSCQKEVNFQDGQDGGNNNNNNKSIIGDWDFVGLSANTYASVTEPSPLGDIKAITTSVYHSKNNTGSIKITATDFIYNNLGYDIDTTMNLKMYMGSMLMSDDDFPFVFSAPVTNGTTPYTKVNSDSLTATGFAGAPDPTGTMTMAPTGVKIAWSGDTLLLKVA
ncbi:MAG TPA: hypothetical protein VF476_05325, partial [Chitinophagaceae bacterium]